MTINDIGADGARVSTFAEKPQAGDGLINGGVFDARVFEYLNDDPGLIFEAEPLKRLAQDEQLMLFRHDGFWQPMDTYREWRLLNEMWESGEAPWQR
jgi:glucose-1-phosphate cytidylyltransferase